MADIFLDGAFRDGAGAIDASDRGLTLGDGVFDTALVVCGRVFRRAAHQARLEAALEVLGIGLDPARITAAYDALAARAGHGAIRLTVTRGPGPRGLAPPPDPRPTLLGAAFPLAPGAMFQPLRLGVAAGRRNAFSQVSGLKALGYLDAVIANAAARRAGADEALFLNTAGRLACSALANVFVETPAGFVTPPLGEGALPGIMRALVLEIAPRIGLRVAERPVEPSEAAGAPLLLTNSLRLASPAAIDRAPAPPGPAMVALMAAVCAAIEAECGVDPRALGARLD